jgi:hypothetical protein
LPYCFIKTFRAVERDRLARHSFSEGGSRSLRLAVPPGDYAKRGRFVMPVRQVRTADVVRGRIPRARRPRSPIQRHRLGKESLNISFFPVLARNWLQVGAEGLLGRISQNGGKLEVAWGPLF